MSNCVIKVTLPDTITTFRLLLLAVEARDQRAGNDGVYSTVRKLDNYT